MLRTLAALCIGAALTGAGVTAARAADAGDARELVRDARATFEHVVRAKEASRTLPDLLRRARAVLIFPRIYKAAFFVGGSGGNGVLMMRGPQGWQGPSFYTVGSVSLGVQIGGQESSTVITVMTEKGLNAILDRKVKLGADLSVAAGPLGKGVGAATGIAENADMYSFSTAKGLFIGGALDGAVIAPNDDYDRAAYGHGVTTRTAAMHGGKLGGGLRQDLGQY